MTIDPTYLQGLQLSDTGLKRPVVIRGKRTIRQGVQKLSIKNTLILKASQRLSDGNPIRRRRLRRQISAFLS
ncbi:hypothetical protein UAJ10_24705 [Nitrospirillum sp. BR 11164]|uniref:hypothetical protein n=1 Tax=Nitrospirillum sp. BR 11164 TaxID=3104324 RepID=UPI002AFFA405|nr:hypothetical protein [Nitrospirillum sp. BR 11164]MEA1652199.1 hypothetical protein [Nitrospirillum sp. BR 11164]